MRPNPLIQYPSPRLRMEDRNIQIPGYRQLIYIISLQYHKMYHAHLRVSSLLLDEFLLALVHCRDFDSTRRLAKYTFDVFAVYATCEIFKPME
jgi:hypothetical protein